MFFSPVDVKIVALRNGLYVFFFGEERLYFQLQEMLKIDTVRGLLQSICAR